MYTVYFIGSATHTTAVPAGTAKTLAAAKRLIIKQYCNDSQGFVVANAAGMVTHQTGLRGGLFKLHQPQPLANFGA